VRTYGKATSLALLSGRELRRCGSGSAPRVDEPVLSRAYCVLCSFEWDAFCPDGIDIDKLECPQCHCLSGIFCSDNDYEDKEDE